MVSIAAASYREQAELAPVCSHTTRTGVQIFGFTLSVPIEFLIVAALGVVFVSWVALSFGKQE